MNRIFSTLILTVILLFLLPFKSSAINYEPNNGQQPAKTSQFSYSGESKQNILYKTLLSRFDILLGFTLGLSGTIFIDYIRRKRKTTEYRRGMRAELKQSLARLTLLALNQDADITVEKVQSWRSLSNEFELRKETCPLIHYDSYYEKLTKKDFSKEDINQFVELHHAIKVRREQGDSYQSIKKINCIFITNNITSISLLNKSECSLMLNILRRLDIINDQISRLEFTFERTYDSNVSSENHERLRGNYLCSCQFLSDWSYETAKEIACLLRK